MARIEDTIETFKKKLVPRKFNFNFCHAASVDDYADMKIRELKTKEAKRKLFEKERGSRDALVGKAEVIKLTLDTH